MVIVGEPAVGNIKKKIKNRFKALGCSLIGRALAFGAKSYEFKSHHPNKYFV